MEKKSNLFGTTLRSCYLAGILASEDLLRSGNPRPLHLYRTSQAATCIVLFTVVVSQLAAMYRYWGDTVILLETVGNTAATAVSFWTNIYPMICEKRILSSITHKETYSVLASPLMQTHVLLRNILDKTRRKLQLVCLGIHISIVCCILFWIISPFIIRYLQGDLATCKVETNSTLTPSQLLRSDGYDQFCFIMWSPIDAKRWYALILGYQILCYLVGFRSLVTFSSVLIHFYVLTAAEFEVIGALVKLVDDTEEEMESSGHKLALVNMTGKANTSALSTTYLKEVIKLHQATIEAADKLNAIQGGCISGGVGSLMALIIASMFEITMVPSLTPKFLCVILAAFMQIFVYSFFGETIYNESEQIGEIAYSTQWYERSTEFKRLVYMIMVRASSPTVWQLLGMISVRVVVFSDITTVCYRVFMLLTQLETEVTEVC